MTRLRRSESIAASARQARKEFRALALPWLATIALMVGLSLFRDFRGLAIAAYFCGAAALGALSVGHEYTYRTLSMLLVQPVSRGRMLRSKLIVLLPMLLALLAVASVTSPFGRGDDRMVLQWMPPIVALLLAPWLTMICRHVIAGMVFAVALPGMAWVLSQLIATVIHGPTREADSLRAMLFSITSTVACAAGAVLGVRKFFTLEAIDGRDAPVQLPAWLRPSVDVRAPSGRRHHAVWMLVKKELHLQQMALIVSAIYLAVFAVVWLVEQSGSRDVREAFDVLSVFYAGLIAVLIGSVASAEERHLGTIDWQVMLPVAAWKQWAIKMAVTLGLAAVMSIGLPILFARGINPLQPRFVMLIVIATCGAVYVSSRSSSGIQALLISVAAAPAVAFVLGTVVFPYTMALSDPWQVIVVGLVFAAVALRLGLAHHRSLPRSTAR